MNTRTREHKNKEQGTRSDRLAYCSLFIVPCFLVLVLFAAIPADAQVTVNFDTITPLAGAGGLSSLVTRIYTIGAAIIGFAAFFSVVLAGMQYITSGGNPGKQSEAKERIRDTALGLLLFFFSYFLLQTINPRITDLTKPCAYERAIGPDAYNKCMNQQSPNGLPG